MVTLEDLQQQIVDLQEKVAAITDPPTDYYTHLWSGEEIDDAINRSRVGGSIDTALSNKVNVDEAYGVTNQIANDLNVFTVNQTVAFDESTLNRPPNFHFGTATIIGNVGWNIGTQIAISTAGRLAIRYVGFDNQLFGDWILEATATSPQEYDLQLTDGILNNNFTKSIYFVDQFGIVTVSIQVHGTSTVSPGTTIAQLPAGFRPKIPKLVYAATGVYLAFDPDGNINMYGQALEPDQWLAANVSFLVY